MTDPLDPAEELSRAQRRMRRRMLLTGAVAGCAALAAIAAVVVLSPPTRDLPAIARPYLWRVTPAGGGRPSYLFGTLHVGYGVDELPVAVLRAQDQADVTVVESDLIGVSPAPAPSAPSVPAVMIHDGADRLRPDGWRSLAARTGVAVEVLQTQSTSNLVGAVLATGLRRVEPMDRALQARAMLRGARLVFLEDRNLEAVLADGGGAGGAPAGDPAPTDAAVEPGGAREELQQAARAARAADQQLAPLLADAVDHPDLVRASLRQMARAYASGVDGGCATAGLTADLVPSLNHDWVDAVDAAVRAGGAFVAIGCSHLDGPGSIVERLRERGHEVARVTRVTR